MIEAEEELLTCSELLMIQTTILMDIIKTGRLYEALCLLLVKIYGKKVWTSICCIPLPLNQEVYKQVMGCAWVRWTGELGRCWVEDSLEIKWKVTEEKWG